MFCHVKDGVAAERSEGILDMAKHQMLAWKGEGMSIMRLCYPQILPTTLNSKSIKHRF